MSRMWAALSGWEKARLLGSMLWMGARCGGRAGGQAEDRGQEWTAGAGEAGRHLPTYQHGVQYSLWFFSSKHPAALLALPAKSAACTLLLRSAPSTTAYSKKDSGEMKHEIERLKETDAMSAAVAEFAKVWELKVFVDGVILAPQSEKALQRRHERLRAPLLRVHLAHCHKHNLAALPTLLTPCLPPSQQCPPTLAPAIPCFLLLQDYPSVIKPLVTERDQVCAWLRVLAARHVPLPKAE